MEIVVSNSLELIEEIMCLYIHYYTMVKANMEKTPEVTDAVAKFALHQKEDLNCVLFVLFKQADF